MKFSSAILLVAALFSVQDVEAVAWSAAAFGVETFHETAAKDTVFVSGTVGVAFVASTAGYTLTVVLPSTSGFKIAAADSTPVKTTDYKIFCGTTEWGTGALGTAAYTDSGTSLVITLATHADTVCAVGGVLKVQLVTVTATPGTQAQTGITITSAGAINTIVTAATFTGARGTFATVVASSLTVAAVAGKDSTTTTLQFTGSTLGANGKFTVSFPGYSLAASNQCTFTATTGTNPTVAVTGSTADVSPWEFTLLGTAMTAQVYTFACDKVTAPAAAQVASTIAVIVGDTTQTVLLTGTYVLPAVVTAAPFAAALGSAGGSMVAVVLGSFAALCLLF